MNILKTLFDNGGITLNQNLQEVKNLKYVASFKDFEITRDLKTLTIAEFLGLIENFQLKAIEKNALIGLWIDKDLIYFDVSKNFENKEVCLKFARENEQKAIFNAIEGESVYL